MAVKLIVMYPRPKNIDAFEYAYKNEHVSMAVEKMTGKTKIVATKIAGSPFGTPAFHRVAEVYFPSLTGRESVRLSKAGSSQLLTPFPFRREVLRRSLSPRKRLSCSRKPGMVKLDLPYSRNGNTRDLRGFDISEVF